MTSDPNHVSDEEIATVRGEDPADAARRQGSNSTDTGDRVDTDDATDETDTGDVTDRAEAEAALSGAGDTGVMMDAADSGTLDRTDVIAPRDADADESDR